MYKLAKDKKASRMFIVNEILDDGFNASAQGKFMLVMWGFTIYYQDFLSCNAISKKNVAKVLIL